MTSWFYLLLKPNDPSRVGEAPSNLNVKVVSVDLLPTTTGVTATGGPGKGTLSLVKIFQHQKYITLPFYHVAAM